ncbi:MAG: transcriptional regulator, MarR family [Firmicutes bacterium]|nr:transcriptional regulator, MarR family [Bacillota bacterium]
MSKCNQAKLLRENLRVLVRKLGVLEREEASCCDVTLSQCHTIVELGRAGSISINALAEVLGLDKSTVSRSVDKLVNDNLIVRDTDPEDRRYLRLKLSEKGQLLFAEVEARMSAYFENVIDTLPANKREQVIESLQYLAQALPGFRCC